MQFQVVIRAFIDVDDLDALARAGAETHGETHGSVEGKFAEAYATSPAFALSTVVGLRAADALAQVVNR